MDELRLKEKIRACELKISDMEQQLLILRMKIERERQILKGYQESLKNQNYVVMAGRF
jgi:predicted double-glycine peptidase